MDSAWSTSSWTQPKAWYTTQRSWDAAAWQISCAEAAWPWQASAKAGTEENEDIDEELRRPTTDDDLFEEQAKGAPPQAFVVDINPSKNSLWTSWRPTATNAREQRRSEWSWTPSDDSSRFGIKTDDMVSPQREEKADSKKLETAEHSTGREKLMQSTSQLKWQDDFTGEGHEPLKGKYFNDLIIEKHSGGEILQIIDDYMLEFSVVNAVTALHRIAKAGDGYEWRKDPRIKYLNRRITKMFASAKRDEIEKKETGRRVPGAEWVYYIDTRSLCNASWAFAQLHLRHDEMMEAISEETCKKIFDCNAQQLAICAWSYAKMMRVDIHLMQTMAEEMIRRMQEFNGQHLMNTVWACAKLKFLHVELLMAVADTARPMLEDFTPQHLSITAWAYGTLGFRHTPLMHAIAEEVIKTVRAFRPQNIANTAWAFASLDLKHAALLNCLARAAIPKLHEFSPQNLSNLVWAFSTLRIINEELFEAAAQQVISRTAEFDPQGLSIMASVYCSLHILHEPLFRAIAQSAISRIDDFGPRDLESIVYAFATVGMDAPELFEAVAQRALPKLKEFNSLDLANIAWAFAKVGYKHTALLREVVSNAVRLIGEGSFPSQALANIAAAYHMLDMREQRLFDAVSREVVHKIDRQDLQHIVSMLELDLPCKAVLGQRLGTILYHLIVAWPKTAEGWCQSEHEDLMVGLKVDHIGEVGSRFVLHRVGISPAAPVFSGRAAQEIQRHFEYNPRPRSKVASNFESHSSTVFVDYVLNIPERSAPFSGSYVQEHAEAALQEEVRWLRPVRNLKVGPILDRALCGEYRVLEQICKWVLGNKATGATPHVAHITGKVRLYGRARPCISCLGAMVQFRQRLSGVVLEVSFGDADGVES